jgi:hypothetical protein
LRPFQSNAKGKKVIICKNIFLYHFEFFVTVIQTRAQGFKSKTLTHPAMEAYALYNKVALKIEYLYHKSSQKSLGGRCS